MKNEITFSKCGDNLDTLSYETNRGIATFEFEPNKTYEFTRVETEEVIGKAEKKERVWDVRVREIPKQTHNYPIELKLDLRGGHSVVRTALEKGKERFGYLFYPILTFLMAKDNNFKRAVRKHHVFCGNACKTDAWRNNLMSRDGTAKGCFPELLHRAYHLAMDFGITVLVTTFYDDGR